MNAVEQLAEELGLNVEDLTVVEGIETWNNEGKFVRTSDKREFLLYEDENDAEEAAINAHISIIEEGNIPDVNVEQYVKPSFYNDLADDEATYKAECGTYEYDEAGRSEEQVEHLLRVDIENALYDIDVDEVKFSGLIDSFVDSVIATIEFNHNEDGQTYEGVYDETHDFITRNPIAYLNEQYDTKTRDKVLLEQSALDVRAMAEEVVREDGIANILAGYDGRQIDLCEGAVAFRHN